MADSMGQALQMDVVSVQSQVVYGRVGNNVAVPVLEAQGLAVAAVPSVVLSNTPHYPTMHGGAIPVEWFRGYLRDLSERGALHALRAVLTGYLGSPEQATVLADWAGRLVSDHVDLQVVVDPVLGDHGNGIYVDAGMPEAYRQQLLPLADGMIPNDFELARLTGQPIHDLESIVSAARTLLTRRTRWVVVTSAAPDRCAADEMHVVLVTRQQAWIFTHARVDASPKGVGDLFSAVLTGQWINGAPLTIAVTKACQQVVHVLHHTRRAQRAELLLPPLADTVETRVAVDMIRCA